MTSYDNIKTVLRATFFSGMKWLWIESNGGYFVNMTIGIGILLTGWK
jgi:hypothetical protein